MISVVVPFFNEEENIEPLHTELSNILESLERGYCIIFVDDGSTDNTYRNMIKVREKDDKVKIIKFRKNFGQSAALKAGFDNADGNIVISMDGDLQNDPSDIPKFIEKIENEDYDVICGWRADRKDPFSKKISSKFANLLRKMTTGEKIHDSGCTFRAYRNGCVKGLDLYGEIHRYIPAMLLWRGYKIGEVKVKHHPRKYGVTKYGLLRLGKGLLDLIVISFWQRYSVRPIHVFGGLGLLLGLSGVSLGGYMGMERLLFGQALSNRPLFLLAILMIIIGVQFVASGILADIMCKLYYGQNERKNYLIEKVTE
ncbi:MAG TPA: glycosyltransferase family 2 protein [Candidatus Methanoperedens sp.]